MPTKIFLPLMPPACAEAASAGKPDEGGFRLTAEPDVQADGCVIYRSGA